MKKTQKLLIMSMLLLCMVFVSACGSEKTESDKVSEETEEAEPAEEPETEKESKTGQIISISMAEMEEKLDAGETFLVSFVTIDCPYCQDFHSMLVDYVQNHSVIMYQVILDYEETPEAENREKIAEYFTEFSTVPGVFFIVDKENYIYLDTYHLGVGMDVFDEWVQENNIEDRT